MKADAARKKLQELAEAFERENPGETMTIEEDFFDEGTPGAHHLARLAKPGRKRGKKTWTEV